MRQATGLDRAAFVTGMDQRIDDLLASALRGEPVVWPSGFDAAQGIDRIAYHGIAGLLNERVNQLADWPAPVKAYLHDQGIALAMWELRHNAVLADLIDGLSAAGVDSLILKGTALAYDLYPLPATRARGDSDLLIASDNLAAARAVFERLGFALQPLDDGIADDLALQEVWSLHCSAGTRHDIDLHWQLINAPALSGLLDFASCSVAPLALPRLHPAARAMSRSLTLLHSCIHRAMHLTSPYVVDGVTHYGGDRLIWARDIDLLANALSDVEWRGFTAAAIAQDVAAVCTNGLTFARRTMATQVPDVVLRTLEAATGEQASSYLLDAGQARRAWLDFRAIPGLRRKIAYFGARSLPSGVFMRGKYPALANRPLAWLHLRRIIELVLPRPGRRAK